MHGSGHGVAGPGSGFAHDRDVEVPAAAAGTDADRAVANRPATPSFLRVWHVRKRNMIMVVILDKPDGVGEGVAVALKIHSSDVDDVTEDESAVADLLIPVDPPGDDEHLVPDPEPEYRSPGLDDRLFAEPDKPATRKVTTAVKKDIKGKLTMLLMVIGGTWASRDPYCGQALVDAIPDRPSPADDDAMSEGLASSLTELVCGSPELVRWFSTGGRYLRWMSVAMAVQPVIQAMVAHHITHSADTDDPTGQPQQQWAHYGT